MSFVVHFNYKKKCLLTQTFLRGVHWQWTFRWSPSRTCTAHNSITCTVCCSEHSIVRHIKWSFSQYLPNYVDFCCCLQGQLWFWPSGKMRKIRRINANHANQCNVTSFCKMTSSSCCHGICILNLQNDVMLHWFTWFALILRIILIFAWFALIRRQL